MKVLTNAKALIQEFHRSFFFYLYQLREELSNAVSSIVVEDVDNLNMVTGTLSNIVKDPNEISPSSQSNILDKNKAFITLLEGDVSQDVMQDALAGLLESHPICEHLEFQWQSILQMDSALSDK